jgi:heme/copper-type cytochrome/quinol oxidase subunit 2
MAMKSACVIVLLLFSACGSSKQFDAIPSDIDRQNVLKDTVDITAESYKFTPEVIRVKVGTLVTFKIKAIDGTHGFQLNAFGIDERLDENESRLSNSMLQIKVNTVSDVLISAVSVILE